MSDLRVRVKRQHTIYKAKSRSQNRYDCDILTLEHLLRCLADRCLDFHIHQRQIACRLIAHERDDLLGQLSEFLVIGLLFSHQSDLVLN